MSNFTTAIQTSSSQFGRKWGLIVGSGNDALDLSALEIEFKTVQSSESSPDTALIRIFNPNPNTVNKIQKEYTSVALQAGYLNGNFGVIFNGTIMQVRTGKLSNVDRFLDIMAADGYLWHSYGFVNTTISANASNQSQLSAMTQSLNNANVNIDPHATEVLAPTGGILPRGKVLMGTGRAYLNDLSDKTNSQWFIENGTLKFMALDSYLPGEEVIINSNTGMVGVPESTESGIMVKCLLNPKIKIGTRVKLNPQDIVNTTVKQQGYPTYKSTSFFASLNPNGDFVCIVKEHLGQTRGNTWYTNLVCLNIDPSSGKVLPYGQNN